MPRRKPQHVERRDATRNAESESFSPADAQATRASLGVMLPLDPPNGDDEALVILMSSDDDDDDDDGEQHSAHDRHVSTPSPPQPKRRRLGLLARGRIGQRPRYSFRIEPSARSSPPSPPSRDADALWLTLPIGQDSALCDVLRHAPPAADALSLVLRSDDEYDDDVDEPSALPIASVDAAQALGDASVDWIGDALYALVVRGVVTMELSRAPVSREFEWRVGVNWSTYTSSIGATAESFSASPPAPRDGASRAMGDVMAWLLWRSRGSKQWTYPYADEIEALYRRRVLREWPSRPIAFDIHDVYAQIDVKRQLSRDSSNVPTEIEASGELLARLRPYQRAAVSWMLSRETAAPSRSAAVAVAARCVTLQTQPGLFFDPVCARFFKAADDPSAFLGSSDLNVVSGGILADEMGLGKTVEVITLVLSHRAPSAEPRPVSGAAPPAAEQQGDASAPESPEAVACICRGTSYVEPGWIQCERCSTWHHLLCTGLSETSGVSFVCFQCHGAHGLLWDCKTTLVVSPAAIHEQWESELTRHVKPGTLRLLRYPGVKELRGRLDGRGPSAEWRLLARPSAAMAQYDVVLTTYEALASDLFHLPTESGHERRASTRSRRKRYAFITSPLVHLRFWRVCMDEAQVGVENTRLQAALTVARLSSRFRWVVTGTPLSTSVRDLLGCFSFLGILPFSGDAGEAFFRELVEKNVPFGALSRVKDMLLWNGEVTSLGQHVACGGGLLWRTAKRDVLEQLGLPRQSHTVAWCRFSDVERYCYDQLEVEILETLRKRRDEQRRQREQLASGGSVATEDERSDEHVSDDIVHDVWRLRQLCCHPQVGQALQAVRPRATHARRHRRTTRPRRQVSPTSSVAAAPLTGRFAGMALMTMDDFLDELLDKSRTDCEEAQRKIIAAQNGLASLALIDSDVAGAILKYLVAIKMIRENWAEVRADLLPRLHILENCVKCVRDAFQFDAENELVTAQDERNPKADSMMPDVSALASRVVLGADGRVSLDARLTPDDRATIRSEWLAMHASGQRITAFYLRQVEAAHAVALERFRRMQSAVDSDLFSPTRASSSSAMLCSTSAWWLRVLRALPRARDQTAVMQLIDRLRAKVLSFGSKWGNAFASRFRDAHGLSLALTNELTTLEKKRRAIYEKLARKSAVAPTRGEIEASGNCKKCREARDGPSCWHCRFYNELEGFRQHFLGLDSAFAAGKNDRLQFEEPPSDAESAVGQADESLAARTETTGTSAATSLLIVVFREVALGARTIDDANGSVLLSVEDAHDRLREESDLWAGLMREWTSAKKLFQAQHQRLGALDELEMARMQIRLREPDEHLASAADKMYKLERFEVPLKREAFHAELVVAEAELAQHRSQLRYLRHLQSRTAHSHGEDPAQQACVVCLEAMSGARAVLPCAHTMCSTCLERLATTGGRRATSTVRCPTCRRLYHQSQTRVIHDASTGAQREQPSQWLDELRARSELQAADRGVQLLQSGFGCKLDAISRRVLALAKANPALKALVFTQWGDMMDVATAALSQNAVKCFKYTSKRQFPRVMQAFKLCPEPCALVLPYKVGANGLNIIEATEVLLLEPLVNTSIEAQAINRVHRIGQTKPTRVHRFVVGDSIEERIHWLSRHQDRSHAPREHGAKDDSPGPVDDSLIIARNEQERMTQSTLRALLNDDALDGNDEHPFWRLPVVLDGRSLPRRDALQLLQRRHAAETRSARSEASSGRQATALADPHTHLLGVSVRLLVARDLLSLKEADATVEPWAHALTPLVDMHRARIAEE
ncbi:hypothetical protein ATCC90586_005498 [Pythium insidiosum]|nr:hypothetical protein ATCC90586_005498 [Pythium insidiosum]